MWGVPPPLHQGTQRGEKSPFGAGELTPYRNSFTDGIRSAHKVESDISKETSISRFEATSSKVGIPTSAVRSRRRWRPPPWRPACARAPLTKAPAENYPASRAAARVKAAAAGDVRSSGNSDVVGNFTPAIFP